MKTSLLKNCIFVAFLPALLSGQPVSSTPYQDLEPIKGVRELSFGGSGGSNRELSDSFGGASVSYGVYLSDQWQGVIRQSVNYHNPRGGSTTWNGSTRIAFDYHITDMGSAMPFFGVNAGRIYGTSLRDSWTAGLEAGLKYYVQPRIFVFAMAEYNWFFQSAREIDDRDFGSGQFSWTAGIGFNF